MFESPRATLRTLFLSASDVLASVPSIPLGRDGRLNLHVVIDNGTENGAPTDTPSGTWQLWIASSHEVPVFSRLTSTAVDTELAKLNTNGNAVVSAFAIFTNVPGVAARLLYVRSSGGATTRARVFATVS